MIELKAACNARHVHLSGTRYHNSMYSISPAACAPTYRVIMPPAGRNLAISAHQRAHIGRNRDDMARLWDITRYLSIDAAEEIACMLLPPLEPRGCAGGALYASFNSFIHYFGPSAYISATCRYSDVRGMRGHEYEPPRSIWRTF